MPKTRTKKIVTDDQKHEEAQDQDWKTGEDSISGSAADPESDDNALDAAKAAGLYNEADEEHPVEVGIAEEVEKDEKQHQKED